MSQPRNIVISHVYSSDNKGDAALTAVLIKDVKRVFPGARLTILKLDAVHKTGVFEGVPEQPAFMHFALNKYNNAALKFLYVIFMIPATLLWAWWFRVTGGRGYLPGHLRGVADIYIKADLIIGVGGGYLRSRAGLANRFNVPLLLHPLLFTELLGRPTVLYAQSIGPFVNGYELAIVAAVLRRMALIILREDISVKLLKKMGVTKNVVRSIDSGFLLRTAIVANVRQRYKIPTRALLVGVTVRDWLQGDAQKAYEQAVAAALDNMVRRHKARIVFIPQVTATKGDDDRTTSRRVHKLMRHAAAATVIGDELDHYQIKAIYNELDVLLGTRFHSVIFSLTSYVPVLAIEYEHKTSGIMHDLGLDKWVIKIELASARALTKGLQALVVEQKQYRIHLKQHVPPYVERATRTADLLTTI